MENLKRIPDTFEGRGDLRGWLFTLVCREDLPEGGAVAVYCKSKDENGTVKHMYEAVRIRIRAPYAAWGETMPAESYPGSERFGQDAYDCTTLDRALWRMYQLKARN